MDRSKSKGDFSTAYKLSRKNDSSKQRLQRRSIEWKEIRQEQVDKRRNINKNLSPVLEGDATQQQTDKSYKGQTPTKRPETTKPTSAAKVNDRLEMLKKWKADRDQKKREEQKNKKVTHFRVSKNVDHKDASVLFKKQQLAKQPIAARVQSKTAKRSEPANEAGVKTSSQTHTRSQQPQGPVKGSQKTNVLKSHSPKASVLKKTRSPKSLKRPHSPKMAAAAGTRGRLGRSTTQVTTKQQPTNTRTLRSQKQKVEKATKTDEPNCSEELPPPSDLTPHRVSLTKVNSGRGGTDLLESFAPNDTTFSAPANISSFVFKPLSPASAATFLFPNQDPSTCASFLETKPNRASTPKSADKEKNDKTVIPDAAETDTTMDPKETGMEKEVETETTTVEARKDEEPKAEQKTDSPIKTRQSTRRSVSTAGESASNIEVNKDITDSKLSCVTPGKQTRSVEQVQESASDGEVVSKVPAVTPARSVRKTRRSVLPTVSETDTNSGGEVAETVKNVSETPSQVFIDTPQSTKRSRHSFRRSVISSVENNETVDEDTGSPAKRPRRSRRSTATVENSNTDGIETAEDKAEKLTRSSHKSSRKSNVGQATTEMEKNSAIKNKQETPISSRRGSRRSAVSQALDDSVFANENKENEAVREDAAVATPGVKNIESVKDVKSEKRVTRGAFRETVSDSATPARQKGKVARRSFGGFAMPNSTSRVLSAKRRGRKSMMPRSPEEWVNLLNNSPMVEMTRRTPKAAAKPNTPAIPPLNFDDIDLENLPPAANTEPTVAMDTSVGEENETRSSNLTQPMAILNLDMSDTARMTSPLVEASASPVCTQRYASPVASQQPGTPVTRRSTQQEPSSPGGGSSQSPATRAVPRSPEAGCSWMNTDNLQVEEVSSTEDYLSDELLRIKYFRDLLESEKSRLRGLCSLWDDYNGSASELSDDTRGQIRSVIGQAVLLMSERFKQFNGLVDNCEFKRGEKETTVTDLQGFWDMIYFQVEDVTAKFDRLEKLKNNNWVEEKVEPAKKKLVVKKKVIKPAAPKRAVKSKFAAFRAQMKQQQQQEDLPGSPNREEEKVFEVPGFFTVTSPIRSPRLHCKGGTPMKSREETPLQDDSTTDNLAVPSAGSGGMLNRTPARKSYVPVVPSPLLKDTTPLPRPVRSCTKKTPVPKRLLDNIEPMVVDDVHPLVENLVESESAEKKTPKRRSLRARKSVTFDDNMKSITPVTQTASSPVTECSDAEFARLLQPVTVQNETDVTDEANDSFSKYLKPSRSFNTSVNKENTPKVGRRRRSSLKTTKSSEKRRSKGHVHFISPVTEHNSSLSLPHTPYNRDSLVKQKRVTRHSEGSATKKSHDVFDIENIDEDDTLSSLPSHFSRPAQEGRRVSLLYTPPKTQKRTPTNKNVPTATLVSFSP